METNESQLSILNTQLIDVTIVDDHKIVVESLSKMINETGIARVRSKHYSLQSCREGMAKEASGVLLLDIEFPDGNGIDFCSEMKASHPELKIIMLTSYKEFNIAKHALHNGAIGYVLKNADPEEIFFAIEKAAKGERFLCEEINMLLKDREDSEVIWLTNREKEILKYTADGYTAKETADLIFRDVETVKTCRKNLFIKLGARNMAELVKRGYEMKLI
jgi:DNA-binding NarL/FixJ family response regulator